MAGPSQPQMGSPAAQLLLPVTLPSYLPYLLCPIYLA